MKRFLGIMLAATVATLGGVPARSAFADDAANLPSALKAASAGVRSFRIQLLSPMGMTSIMTVNRDPMRMHMRMASGPITMEMYLADGVSYTRIGNTPWRKQALPSTAATMDMMRTMTDSSHIVAGADVTEGGATYGSYDLQVDTASIPGAPSAPPMKLTCTYDKKTYLVHDCKNAFVTETFLGYNDPDNAIVLPADLANAVDAGPMMLPAPLPATAPK